MVLPFTREEPDSDFPRNFHDIGFSVPGYPSTFRLRTKTKCLPVLSCLQTRPNLLLNETALPLNTKKATKVLFNGQFQLSTNFLSGQERVKDEMYHYRFIAQKSIILN